MTDAYHELIDALSETPRRLQTALVAYEPGARSTEVWGPAEILAHLVDVEKLQRGRIQTILGSREAPYLRAWNQEAAARERDYASADLQAALGEFARERGETISLLMNLAIKDWDRTGIHEELGEISVEDITERLMDHDAEHVAEVEKLTA